MTPEMRLAQILGQPKPSLEKVASVDDLSVDDLEQLLRQERRGMTFQEKVAMADSWGREMAHAAYEKVAAPLGALGQVAGRGINAITGAGGGARALVGAGVGAAGGAAQHAMGPTDPRTGQRQGSLLGSMAVGAGLGAGAGYGAKGALQAVGGTAGGAGKFVRGAAFSDLSRQAGAGAQSIGARQAAVGMQRQATTAGRMANAGQAAPTLAAAPAMPTNHAASSMKLPKKGPAPVKMSPAPVQVG